MIVPESQFADAEMQQTSDMIMTLRFNWIKPQRPHWPGATCRGADTSSPSIRVQPQDYWQAFPYAGR
jgi:hypothetical protein